jgi:hypothetical protein
MGSVTPPQLQFPTSPPIGLSGGTTPAAQITALNGALSAQVSNGTAVYSLLRWIVGLSAWVPVRVNGQDVQVEPNSSAANGTTSTIFQAIPGTYYTVILSTGQPAGNQANLLGIDISNAGSPVTALTVVLDGDVDGLSNANVVNFLQDNPLALGTLGPSDVGKAIIWNGSAFIAEIAVSQTSNSFPFSGAATNTSSQAFPSRAARTGFQLTNNDATNVLFLAYASQATINDIPVQPGQSYRDPFNWTGPVSVITASGQTAAYSGKELTP